MHPICSWMVTVDLCDELEVTRLARGRLSRYAILWHPEARRRSEIDWSITRDLAVRAHLALERAAGRPLPVQMTLRKRIPVGGGLGGGSSDAAAMLRAVNALFDLGLGPADLRRLAAGLGSDVPFFVAGGSAVVEGFGEQVHEHAEVPEIHAVLAIPECRCPTGEVYAAYDRLRPGGLRPQAVRAAEVFNDLAEAAISVAPRLAEHRRDLADLAGRPAHVAGSGSSLFVLCDEAAHAAALVEVVQVRLGLPAVAVRSVPLGDGR
jgi:4-diphosphocytidyl-2-C-methyl-D-erythritol kinase